MRIKSLYDTAPGAGAANPDGNDIYGHPQSLFLTETGDARAIEPSDIHQGTGLGDCFLLSPLGMIAELDPGFIRSHIRDNGDGTQTVHLFVDAATGGVCTFSTMQFIGKDITVNDRFVAGTDNTRLNGDGTAGGHEEIWSQVYEKAVATLDNGGHAITSIDGYAAIANGGWPVLALETLTGERAFSESPAALTASALNSLLAAHQPVVLDTLPVGGLPGNFVGNHAYMVGSVSGTGAAASVQCINPWGFDQPAAVAMSALSSVFNLVSIGGHV